MMRQKNDILRVDSCRDEIRKTYASLSRIYAAIEGWFEKKQRALLLKMLGLHPGDRVLEAGVGTGFGLRAIAGIVGGSGLVCGVDITAEMIAQARRRIRRAKPAGRVRLVEADARALPFAAERFDAVYMQSTLELFDTPDIPRVLAEIGRVLGCAGRLGVGSLSKEGHEKDISIRIYEWLHRKLPRNAGCRPIYVERSVEDAGFEILSRCEMRAGGVLPVKLIVARRKAT